MACSACTLQTRRCWLSGNFGLAFKLTDWMNASIGARPTHVAAGDRSEGQTLQVVKND
jgi:hypothetical protein